MDLDINEPNYFNPVIQFVHSISGRQTAITRLQGNARPCYISLAREQTDPALLCHLPTHCQTVHGEITF